MTSTTASERTRHAAGRSVAAVALAALLGLSLDMCGGAAASRPPESPSAAPTGGAYPSETKSVQGQPSEEPTPSAAPPAAAATSPGDASSGARAREAARAELARAQRDLETANSDCAAACRALASMERATDHLCALAGDSDDQSRCDDARRKVLAARERVRSTCGSCQ